MWNSGDYYLDEYIYPGTGTGTQNTDYIYYDSTEDSIRLNSKLYVDENIYASENIRTSGYVKSANNVFVFQSFRTCADWSAGWGVSNTSAQAIPFSDVPVNGAWVDPNGDVEVKIVFRAYATTGNTLYVNWTDGAGNWGTWQSVTSTTVGNYESPWESLTWTGLRNFTTQVYVSGGSPGGYVELAFILIKPVNP
jgi:hypothetical protein